MDWDTALTEIVRLLNSMPGYLQTLTDAQVWVAVNALLKQRRR